MPSILKFGLIAGLSAAAQAILAVENHVNNAILKDLLDVVYDGIEDAIAEVSKIEVSDAKPKKTATPG